MPVPMGHHDGNSSDMTYTGPLLTEPKAFTEDSCSSLLVPCRTTTGFETREHEAKEAKHNYWTSSAAAQLTSFQQEMRGRWTDLERKLDSLAINIGGSLDSISLSLSAREALLTKPDFKPSEATLGSDLIVDSLTGKPSPLKSFAESNHREENPESPRSQVAADTADEQHASPKSPTSAPFGSSGVDSDMAHRSLRRKSSLSSLGEEYVAATAALLASRNEYKRKIWAFMEDPESSRAAFIYPRLCTVIIVSSVFIQLLQTLREPVLDTRVALFIGMVFDSLFTFEILLRYIISPSSCVFFKNPNNVIDIFAALPFALRVPCFAEVFECGQETAASYVLLCATPSIQLLKTLRYFEQFHLFVLLANETFDALRVLYVLLFIIVLASASLVYFVEERDNIGSIPVAMYLIITTVSTVGYGDITPNTTTGTLAVSVIILVSVLFMSMPIGLVGSAFTTIWQQRYRILLTIRTRDRLRQWGYTAADMQMIFKHFDRNGDGDLSLKEFRKMVAELRIGIRDERVCELFYLFDENSDGSVDAMELTKALFPSEYIEMQNTGDEAEGDALASDAE